MKSRFMKCLMVVFAFGLVLVVAGCSGQQQEAKVENLKFGTPSETAKKLEIKNNTGKNISTVSVCLSGKTETAQLSKSDKDKTWDNGNTAEIYVEKGDVSSAKTATGDIAVKTSYNLTIQFSDNSSVVLHNLVPDSFDTMKEAELLFSSGDNLAYVQYKENGDQTVSTLEAEKKIVADAKAAEEAAAKAAADAEAAKQQEQNAASSSSGKSKSSGSSSQRSDGCTGGNIALR